MRATLYLVRNLTTLRHTSKTMPPQHLLYLIKSLAVQPIQIDHFMLELVTFYPAPTYKCFGENHESTS